jgi:hypothetical protein
MLLVVRTICSSKSLVRMGYLDAFTGIWTRLEGEKDGDYSIGAQLWAMPSSEFGAVL